MNVKILSANKQRSTFVTRCWISCMWGNMTTAIVCQIYTRNSVDAEIVQHVSRAELDRFRTWLWALQVAAGPTYGANRFAKCDFLLVIYIDLTSTLHCSWERLLCRQNFYICSGFDNKEKLKPVSVLAQHAIFAFTLMLRAWRPSVCYSVCL